MIDKRELDILLLGYKEGQYTHREVRNIILERSDNSDYAAALKRILLDCNDFWSEKDTSFNRCLEDIQRLNATHFA